jgi:hypothetical protein
MKTLLIGILAASPAIASAVRLPVPLQSTVSLRAINVTNSTGAPVRRLRAGDYQISVTDHSPTRNFHLSGPMVNRKTTLVFVGKTVWTLKLVNGTYRFYSDKGRSLQGVITVI